MITLRYNEAVSLLKRAVEQKGKNYVHSGRCVYFDTDGVTPLCIIGHLLSYKGLTASDIGPGRNVKAVLTLVSNGVISCDDQTANLLDFAQSYQDSRTKWGDAVDAAIIITKEEVTA